MNRRVGVIVLTVPFFALSGLARAEETVESIEKKIIAKWAKVPSMTAKTTMDMTMQGMSMKSTGTMEYMKKGEKELYRIEMTMSQSFAGQEMKGGASTVCEGDYVYVLTDMMGQKNAMKQKAEDFKGSPGGEQMFKTLKETNELKVLPDEKVDGQAVYVLEAKPKSGGMQQIAKTKLFFAKDTGIPIKTLGLGPNDEAIMTMTVTDIKLGANVDAARFVFKAPEGVEVIDVPES